MDRWIRLSLVAALVCQAWLGGTAASAVEVARLAGTSAADPSGVMRLRGLDPRLTAEGVAIALVELAKGVRIVAQPFGFDTPLTHEEAWDDFAARHDVLFVSSSGGGPQLPGSMYNGLVVAAGARPLGWDLRTISSERGDACNTYEFTLTADPAMPSITLASTIVWNRQCGKTDINHLTLELYDADTETLVPGAASLSTVDNLQVIYLATIQPGTYQLRVRKPFSPDQVSAEETYALALAASGGDGVHPSAEDGRTNPIDGSVPASVPLPN